MERPESGIEMIPPVPLLLTDCPSVASEISCLRLRTDVEQLPDILNLLKVVPPWMATHPTKQLYSLAYPRAMQHQSLATHVLTRGVESTGLR
jgi:hypothetical protein